MWGLGLQDIDVSSNHYNFRGWSSFQVEMLEREGRKIKTLQMVIELKLIPLLF